MILYMQNPLLLTSAAATVIGCVSITALLMCMCNRQKARGEVEMKNDEATSTDDSSTESGSDYAKQS